MITYIKTSSYFYFSGSRWLRNLDIMHSCIICFHSPLHFTLHPTILWPRWFTLILILLWVRWGRNAACYQVLLTGNRSDSPNFGSKCPHSSQAFDAAQEEILKRDMTAPIQFFLFIFQFHFSIFQFSFHTCTFFGGTSSQKKHND